MSEEKNIPHILSDLKSKFGGKFLINTSKPFIIEIIPKEINKVDVKEILKEVLSNEDVKEKYVRDFLNCSMIDKNSDIVQMDKIMFIYKYGSKKAKKIAVDERLKMI